MPRRMLPSRVRRILRARRDQRGFTVLEVTITGALLSLALAGFLATLSSTQQVSGFTERRTRALDDLRTAAASFSREAREGDGASLVAGNLELSTFLGGATTPTTVQWAFADPLGGSNFDLQRTGPSGTAAPRGLPPLLVGPTASHFKVIGKTVTLVLVTRPSDSSRSVRLETEVTLRNAAI